VRRAPIGIFAALSLWVFAARADRLAVVPLESPGHPAPRTVADQLAADLIRQGHRVIAGADVAARIAMGNQGASSNWAADLLNTIDAARAALTRLDLVFAANIARKVGNDIVRSGGGAGGTEVLVEWSLLERQLALTASDAVLANRWLDAAVAFGLAVQLDPLRHPDAERDAFARRRSTLQDQTPAALSIVATPAAAEVWIDGTQRCQSPCTTQLLPGRHLARVSSAAHSPAVIDLEIPPGEIASRRLGLTAAYSGSSLQAIAAMLADPSRRTEGASALEPMARFLDVDHVVALVPSNDQMGFILAPPPVGQSRFGPVVPPFALSPAVIERLRPISVPDGEPARSWYAKPTTWIIAGGTAALIVGGLFLYRTTEPSPTGTLTVTSSPPGSLR
jgi:PEGA domain